MVNKYVGLNTLSKHLLMTKWVHNHRPVVDATAFLDPIVSMNCTRRYAVAARSYATCSYENYATLVLEQLQLIIIALFHSYKCFLEY